MAYRILCCLGMVFLLGGASGCLATGYKGESYSATGAVAVLERAEQPPADYVLMGRGWVSGEASGTTRKALEARMIKLAEKHGADAMVIMGTILVPAGKMVDDQAENVTEAGADSDQYPTQVSFNQDVGDSGAINSATRFERKMYADFFRKKAAAAQ